MPLRQLLPAPSRANELIETPSQANKSKKSKRRSMACSECREKRTRCTGSPPCAMCSRSGSICIFDSSTDRRRKDALTRATKVADDYRNALITVIKILQHGGNVDVERLRREMIHINTVDGTIEDIQKALDQCHDTVHDQLFEAKLSMAVTQ
ncbi:hypothetical protein FE257_001825 [Aspergillus nanangensis]|uniref:Zn(2)-C6 fungal-type domain-containing protein n=1 Tax=Aspergillus nanangensis TaxID=2582783 RepID=A0AAD4GNN7_ASPNN|nr:hypothetical protein FE257_001825 [Aspergillus nanangensis]